MTPGSKPSRDTRGSVFLNRAPWRLALVLVLGAAVLAVLAYRAGSGGGAPARGSFDPTAFLGDGAHDTLPLDDGPLAFPRDHGAHGEARGEMWRFAGNVRDSSGNPYGFQLAFYRLRLDRSQAVRPSSWAADQAYRAYFAVSPGHAEAFRSFERFSRGALGLAGFEDRPRVWLERWAMAVREARSGTAEFALDAAQGDTGLALILTPSRHPVEGAAAGRIRFYAVSRLETRGRLVWAGEPVEVSGETYFEHAWGNLPPGGGQVVWNRQVIHLEDGRDIVLAQSRRRDGSGIPIASGTVIDAAGASTALGPQNVALEPKGHWRSPATGVTYPTKWRIFIPKSGLRLTVEPLIAAQELNHAARAWSGSTTVSGSSDRGRVTGFGFMELTGY